MTDGSTTGVWIPGDSDLLDRFDSRYGEKQRSSEIRNAMELQLVIDDALDHADWSFPSEREKRHFVRQAVLNEIRRDE